MNWKYLSQVSVLQKTQRREIPVHGQLNSEWIRNPPADGLDAVDQFEYDLPARLSSLVRIVTRQLFDRYMTHSLSFNLPYNHERGGFVRRAE